MILYVLPDNQMSPKSVRFIEELGLEDRITFVVDPGSGVIRRLGLLKRDVDESLEQGVPHPATYILDRRGIVRFADVRTDYHRWLDSELLAEEIGKIP